MLDHTGKRLRTVWVLGAGFSRSLGGPLLPDLFRQEQKQDLRQRYPEASYANLATTCWSVQGLFNWGKESEGRWTDAEQFIEFVEGAEDGSTSHALLQRMMGVAQLVPAGSAVMEKIRFDSPANLRQAVRRALVAECAWFWKDAQTESERWSPYCSWLSMLSPSYDTIVSFNYDGVLECILDSQKHRVEVPGSHNLDDRVKILKLHGSVTWEVNADVCQVVDVEHALQSTTARIAMATPGPLKRGLTKEFFEPLWVQAVTAIERAEVVVFLGYRFPESDAESRDRLLKAIVVNEQPRLRIHVVLGPDLNQRDVVRMHRLVEVCATRTRTLLRESQDTSEVNLVLNLWKTAELAIEPLFAEDFLSLYSAGPLRQYKR
jgi:hypothetical protein